ncbi:Na(+)-translocating NADH-quinone reductase subunit C [bacterium]|nr:Na(+)-translocating NADH-quinone reductase subunit C [bacterium]MDB4090427.1 Na(+)-translocating NADH-quinone reductase subunit C [Pseudomonadales bacterium]MDB4431414.1 Na(+)-translocating NADH-quinone reductase subunit C [Pseudomonadales bacterium]MDB4529061.1 Na(+)-translocating NADH-quinone reductase subunit C [Pseudomonadales bacterium]
MANQDSTGKTLMVAFLLCIVCSVVVSAAAVILRPLQDANKDIDRKRNILLAAGLYDDARSIDDQFSAIQTRLVDLQTGQFSEDVVVGFDQRKAAKDPERSIALDSKSDIAKISRRENQALVYIVESEGEIDKLILPVHGYGLWSTLYGFVALESDLNTVAGLGFYDHAETPGLGGEVDNPRWKALWPGKQVYRDGTVTLGLAKGAVDPTAPGAEYQVDGLSGATLTGRGVTNLIQFWLGEDGFAPFLDNFKRGEA